MRNRPGIFISLIAVVILTAGALGLIVFKQSQHDKPIVAEQHRQYEAEQRLEKEVAKQSQQSQPNAQSPAVAPLSEDPAITGVDQTNTPPQETVQVFFSRNPESDQDTSAVFPVARATNGKPPGNVAVSELIIGPTATEKAEGYIGGMQLNGPSNCDNKDFILKQNTEQNSVELRFCRNFIGNGKLDKAHLEAQITATLTHLTGAKNILLFSQENKCLLGLKANQASCRINLSL